MFELLFWTINKIRKLVIEEIVGSFSVAIYGLCPRDALTPVRVRQPIVNLNRRSSLSRASSVYSTSSNQSIIDLEKEYASRNKLSETEEKIAELQIKIIEEEEKVEQYSEDFSTLKEVSPENLSVDEAEKLVNVQKTYKKIEVPRFYDVDLSKELQLHIFYGASEEAFAAVAYIRGHARGSLSVSIIAGKGKVARAKGMSIPKLELNAAVEGAKLKAYVEKAFGQDLNFARSFLWTDSRTVMCWLTSRTGRFSQYVTNRINLILDYSTLNQWNWINTEENVADDATRLRSSTKMSTSCRWLNGSSFLKSEENKWPRISTKPTVDDSELEKRAIINFINERESLWKMPVPDVKKYSTWTKLIMKTATFIKSFRFKIHKVGEHNISLADVTRAELLWVKQVQLDCFAEEIKQLRQKGIVSTKSKLYQFIPFLNENEVIVVGGRPKKCERVSDQVKFPPILDGNHPYVRLLIHHYHEKNAHHGIETISKAVKQKYWVLKGRTAVRSVGRSCQKCKNEKAKPIQPVMGPLPEGRAAIGEPPFTHCGVDLFGPIEISIRRGHENRWGIIFTCMTTRAVYLDFVPSLTTSDKSFLLV
uniref:Uncharacterized protein LOC114339493 n=1 Tax=Diabrotica virgifera virgifera TaxID=50390 RepID=A0A6P7GL53_DIAVI